MTVEAPPTAVDETRRAAEAAHELQARWETERDTATAELADLQARAGDQALDDPDAARRLPREMQELRDRIDVADRAAARAGQRLADAVRVALRAEAEALAEELAQQQETLDAHNARTAELLEALNEHANDDYRPWRPSPQYVVEMGQVLVPTPVASQLVIAMQPLMRRHQVLLALVDGRDPAQDVFDVSAHEFPSLVWGPEALLPSRTYLASLERAAEARERNLADRQALVERIQWLERAEVLQDPPSKSEPPVPGKTFFVDQEGDRVDYPAKVIAEKREALARLDAELAASA